MPVRGRRGRPDGMGDRYLHGVQVPHHGRDASRSADELSVARSRLIGHDEVRRWDYREITGIEFEYVPGTSGDGGTPPRGVVSVRTAGGRQARIFDGSPCPARDLADAVTSATGVPIRVKAGPRDSSPLVPSAVPAVGRLKRDL